MITAMHHSDGGHNSSSEDNWTAHKMIAAINDYKNTIILPRIMVMF